VGATGQDAPAAPATEPNGNQAPETQDPWTSTLEGVDEVYRPHVEQAINPLREQFTPRLELADRMEPLGDYADDLLALAQDADDSGSALGDVLGFTALMAQLGETPESSDPQALEEFSGWWEEMGERYGLFDDDGGDDPDDSDPEDGGIPPQFEERFARLEQENQALRQELGGLAQNDRVAAETARIEQQLVKGLTDNGIEDNEETRGFIYRLASSYADKENMLELAFADYLKLTGGAQRQMLGESEVERLPAGRSPGSGTPDTSPEQITTGDPAESRKNAHRAAVSRLQAAG
jgi:hypothetical protein